MHRSNTDNPSAIDRASPSGPELKEHPLPSASPALRRLALAVAVLHEVDLVPGPTGLILTGAAEVEVEWATVAAVTGAARRRAGTEQAELDALARWLIARREIANGAALAVRGIPVQHSDHPGLSWIREVVRGDALSLGFGYGPLNLPVPDGVLEHAGIDVAAAWVKVRSELEELGARAVIRDKRHIAATLVPLGSADVCTLLGSVNLRRELAAMERDGLAALIVPLRTRGWRANSVSDPAYGPALAAAMSPEERGFLRPLLVTAEELSEVRAGGDPMRGMRKDDLD